jgi:hypothetical protein
MPISYERNDAQQRIVAIGDGSFSADDVLGIFARMRTDGAWNYGSLYDIRRMTGKPSVGDLRRLLEAASQPGPNGEALGPTAVVVTNPTLYAMACAYAALGPPAAFEVFPDRPQAEAWLETHLKRSTSDR